MPCSQILATIEIKITNLVICHPISVCTPYFSKLYQFQEANGKQRYDQTQTTDFSPILMIMKDRFQLKSGNRLSIHRDVVGFRSENAEQENPANTYSLETSTATMSWTSRDLSKYKLFFWRYICAVFQTRLIPTLYKKVQQFFSTKNEIAVLSEAISLIRIPVEYFKKLLQVILEKKGTCGMTMKN